ncbi:hypothetical protein AN403_6088 [Pseudomonas fluorescens]|uniref:Uncharacterized protein n=1 Tax=Pseudomonas fluorescens TaxID=294 RepID=A0A0P8XND5_PSEFL|nr:hypothetical protein AN403_6088 [Pseudomonas fluorescens]
MRCFFVYLCRTGFQSSRLLSVASGLLIILICLPYLDERAIGVLSVSSTRT